MPVKQRPFKANYDVENERTYAGLKMVANSCAVTGHQRTIPKMINPTIVNSISPRSTKAVAYM